MSVVARQGFKYTIIGYLGFVVGALSTYFVFPYDFEFYGKLSYILSMSEMLVPIVVFGLSYANVKFFHQSQKDGKHQNILSLSLLAIVFNFVVFSALFFLFHYIFPEYQEKKWWTLKFIILPLVFVLALSHVFNRYVSNYKRIVVPNIFENILPKLANLGAFCFFIFLGMTQQSAFAFFFGMFVVSTIGYFFYANTLENIKPDFSTGYIKKEGLWKEILNYSFFGFLGNIGNYIAIKIDKVMIGDALGDEEVGIYSVLFAMISLISIPQLGIFNISAPIINKSIAENDMEELDRFHKKTSLSLFFLGAVLFSCILVGFPYLVTYIKNGALLQESELVIWILGSAILFDLATGFNGNIISLSKYYRYNIVFMMFLAVLTIALNYYFLEHTSLGIVGVALATAISLTLYNIVKIIFNYLTFKIHPLTIEMIFVSIISTLAITVAIVLPDFENNFVNLIYKPSVVLLLIYIGNHFLRIFPVEEYINRNFLKSIFKFK
ncbi:MAG: oligosaccharide flippase family protein [Kaistella sp.]|nr:oligosaccharide flippase family protein [Kaistella sp.]